MTSSLELSLWYLLVGLWIMSFRSANGQTPYAITKVGKFQGLKLYNASGTPYYAFLGIQYGELSGRWSYPQAVWRNNNITEALNYASVCPQTPFNGTVKDEFTCLVLDVYVPYNATALLTNQTEAMNANVTNEDNDSREVMVWIHGGSYNSGSSRKFDAGKIVTEQNIVVVVIQYRLGVFGFLSTGNKSLPGNYGLWDQLYALRWVKDNILAFGGNAGMITIAGESAGASSVSQHAISRNSSGIFSRVVMMSGTAMASWSITRNPQTYFDAVVQNTSCGTTATSVELRLSCLRNASLNEILGAATIAEEKSMVPIFVPNIDGDFFPEDIEILLNNTEYLRSIGFYNYTFLVGVLNNDGAVAYQPLANLYPDLKSSGGFSFLHAEYVIDELLNSLPGSHNDDLKDTVTFAYTYPRDLSRQIVPVQKGVDAITDCFFVVPAVRFLRAHCMISPTEPIPVSYFYLFDWYPTFLKGKDMLGMPHALDVAYLFGLSDTVRVYDNTKVNVTNDTECTISKMFGDMIGEFVRTGNPVNGIHSNAGRGWLPYDVINETYLSFSLTPSVKQHVYALRTSLWLDLVPQIQSHILPVTPSEFTTTSTVAHTSTVFVSAASSPLPVLCTSENATNSVDRFTSFSLTEKEVNILIPVLLAISIFFLLVLLVILVIVVKRRYTRSKKYSFSKTLEETPMSLPRLSIDF